MQELKKWSICEACIHLRETGNPDHNGESPYTLHIQYCKAFPEGIPWAIYPEGYDHRIEFPGDHGVRFELVESKRPLLEFYENDVPEPVRQRDVMLEAQQYEEHLRLQREQLAEVATRVLRGNLLIPVLSDGTPAVAPIGDAPWLGVSTNGIRGKGWESPEYCARWDPITVDRLIGQLDDAVLLLVDDRGPLLPMRKLRSAAGRQH